MRKIKIAAVVLGALLLTGCSGHSVIMVASLSSDGNYAVTSGTDKKLILWNIKEKQSKVITSNANIYSAYFIKGTNSFMYQDNETNEVVIEDVDGNVIKQFNPGFPTYGEAITSNLENYFAVDQNDELFSVVNDAKKQLTFYHCNVSDPVVPQGMQSVCGSVVSDMKISNLVFANNQTQLYSSLAGAVYEWDVQAGSFIRQITSDAGLDNIDISADNQYLVGSDSNSNRGMICDLHSNTCKKITYYMPINNSPLSDALGQGDALMGGGLSNTIKFISSNLLINFIQTAPDPFNYGILYNPQVTQNYDAGWAKVALTPLKFLSLDQEISITDNSSAGRNLSFDTAPSVGVAVSGAFTGNKLFVYQYDSSSQTLNQIWVGKLKPWWGF